MQVTTSNVAGGSRASASAAIEPVVDRRRRIRACAAARRRAPSPTGRCPVTSRARARPSLRRGCRRRIRRRARACPASPPATRSIQSRRSGLISCSGPNIALRIPPAMRERRRTSRARPDRRWRCGGRAGHATCAVTRAFAATAARARASAASSSVASARSRDDALAADPHVGHALAPGDVHEVRHRIVARAHRRASPRSTAIRSASLPGDERADARRRGRARARRRASPCASTVLRRAARPRRRSRPWRAARASRISPKQVEPVVRRRAVGARARR